MFIVRNFFDAESCRRTLDEMRSSPASAAPIYGSGEAAVDEGVRRVARISPSAESVDYVTRRLKGYRPHLEQHFGLELGGFEEPQFLCYRVGDFFVAHQDGNTGLVNLETDRTRLLSMTIFLNRQSSEADIDTYDGGLLVFSNWRTGVRYEVAGETGMMVAFRAETTHEVTPVTRGERYAIVSWFGRREREIKD